jgi:hypothetical protein
MAPRYALVGSGASARPVPYKLEATVEQICAESGTWINSALRTQAAVNYARARGAQLSSQAELYYGFVAGLPGYNPANPPGKSTHERRSDGVAYPRIPAGLPLRFWMCGLDVGGPGSSRANAEAFCAAARRHGWIATITYPTSPLEQHHVNFRKKPRRIPPALKVGSRGKRVRKYSRRLWFLRSKGGQRHYPIHGPKDVFDKEMRRAVMDFQGEYGLVKDGVIGVHTAHQIDHIFRTQWKRRKKLARS